MNGAELGKFLERLDALAACAQRDALQLLLFLGGQRPAQLLRAKVSDIKLSEGIITLYDPKGTRSQPRVHRVPRVKEAISVLRSRLDGVDSTTPLFSSDGEKATTPETLSAVVHGPAPRRKINRAHPPLSSLRQASAH